MTEPTGSAVSCPPFLSHASTPSRDVTVEFMKDDPLRSCVIVPSAVVRGVSTARSSDNEPSANPAPFAASRVGSTQPSMAEQPCTHRTHRKERRRIVGLLTRQCHRRPHNGRRRRPLSHRRPALRQRSPMLIRRRSQSHRLRQLLNRRVRAAGFAVCCRPSVCRLSVTFVHPTKAVAIFGNVSTPYDSPVTLVF